MRALAILTFVTVDGVMQGPGRPDEDSSGGFTAGGWARPCWDEVMQQVMREAMAEPYDLLLGRRTYELFAPNFADAGSDDPVVKQLNAARKYVVTNTLDSLKWHNSQVICGAVVDEIRRLKSGSGPLLQVHGSWQLIQTLLEFDLIDEFRLWTFPRLIGQGKRLFANGAKPVELQLLKSENCECGAIMRIYRRTGDATI